MVGTTVVDTTVVDITGVQVRLNAWAWDARHREQLSNPKSSGLGRMADLGIRVRTSTPLSDGRVFIVEGDSRVIEEALTLLDELDGRLCAALCLRYIEGRSHRSAAERMGVSKAKFQQLLSNAEYWVFGMLVFSPGSGES